MAERGISVAPSTILRWVQHLCAGVPEALESLRTSSRRLVARGWDLREAFAVIAVIWTCRPVLVSFRANGTRR